MERFDLVSVSTVGTLVGWRFSNPDRTFRLGLFLANLARGSEAVEEIPDTLFRCIKIRCEFSVVYVSRMSISS
jgi:hypothetical protein